MSECRKYRELISRFVDGELDALEKDGLDRHLETCDECRSLLCLYRAISDAAASGQKQPPAGLSEAVMEKIKAAPRKSGPTDKRPAMAFVPAAAVAAAAACIALAFLAFPGLFGLGGRQSASPEGGVERAPAAVSAPEAAAGSAAADSSDEDSAKDARAFGASLQAPAPEATPAHAGESPVYAISPADLSSYRAVFIVEGDLPDVLRGLPASDAGNGTYRIVITPETEQALAEAGYAATAGNSGAGSALVVYIPGQAG